MFIWSLVLPKILTSLGLAVFITKMIYFWYSKLKYELFRLWSKSIYNIYIYIYLNIHFACLSVCVSLTIRLRVIILTWFILMKVEDQKKNSVRSFFHPSKIFHKSNFFKNLITVKYYEIRVKYFWNRLFKLIRISVPKFNLI